MVVFHVSTFILLLHYAGGISFYGYALTTTGYAGVRFLIGLPAMQGILATSELVYQTPWLPLTRELLSVSETEGEKCSIGYVLYLFSSSVFLLHKNPPPSSEGGTTQTYIFYCFSVKLFDPRDFSAVFISIFYVKLRSLSSKEIQSGIQHHCKASSILLCPQA